jgi:hypothetical protein
VITHVIPADEVESAFMTARDAQSSGKVLISSWPDETDGHAAPCGGFGPDESRLDRRADGPDDAGDRSAP